MKLSKKQLEQRKKTLWRTLHPLDSKEVCAIRMRLVSMLRGEGLCLRSVGQVFGFTKERARHYEAKGEYRKRLAAGNGKPKLTKEAVIERFCQLATKVGGAQFRHQHAHDCFCSESAERNPADFRFEEVVMEFIEKSVNTALQSANKNLQ